MNISAPPTYHGNGFAMAVPQEGWRNATIHVLNGPADDDGRLHSVTIQALPDVEADSPEAFAAPLVEVAVRSLRHAEILVFEQLDLEAANSGHARRRGRSLQSKQRAGPFRRDGQCRRSRDRNEQSRPPACHVLVRWSPERADGEHYQKQVFVLVDGGAGEARTDGYVLSASFSEASFRSLEKQVEDVMRSFRPVP